VNGTRDTGATVRIPRDPALIGLASLLDRRWFAGAVSSRLLSPGVEPGGCLPLYTRYKPGTNAIVVCSLTIPGAPAPLLVQGKCFAADDFERAREKAVNTGWSDPLVGAPFAICESERILLLAFPNDPVLDGLRFATHPKRMQRAIYAHIDELPEEHWRISDRRLVITPLRFKPEKRAVLRLDTRAVERATGEKRPFRLYLRVDADGRGAHDITVLDHIHRELSAHPIVHCPRPVAYDGDHHLLIVEDAGGAPCVGIANAQAMGSALAALHALPAPTLPGRTFSAHLDGARDTAATVGALDASLAAPAGALLETLMSRAGDAAGPGGLAHGDCHPGQLLLAGERIVLLDFDRCHLGDPASDLGNYLAHADLACLCAGTAPGDEPAAALMSAYTAAGGRRPEARRLALWRSLSLLQLAATPFRTLDPAWPAQTAAVLARGREVLA